MPLFKERMTQKFQ